MGSLIAVAGALWVVVIMWDAFEALVLPRRVTRRLRPTRMFYRVTWRVWSAVARRIRQGGRRETYLSFFGPLSLLVLLAAWAASLIVGFALLQTGLGASLNVPGGGSFTDHLYLSGETFFTLGLGDVTPVSRAGRVLIVIEAGIGFAFLALVIGYLPVLYQSFSRREVNITLLDARAGSPPSAEELLRGSWSDHEELAALLREWERWSAEVLESHLSYPVLSYYRSQHDNQSWLTALTTILDASALVMVGIQDACARQARLTFAMARHAVVDLAQVLGRPPIDSARDRLPASRGRGRGRRRGRRRRRQARRDAPDVRALRYGAVRVPADAPARLARRRRRTRELARQPLGPDAQPAVRRPARGLLMERQRLDRMEINVMSAQDWSGSCRCRSVSRSWRARGRVSSRCGQTSGGSIPRRRESSWSTWRAVSSARSPKTCRRRRRIGSKSSAWRSGSDTAWTISTRMASS